MSHLLGMVPPSVMASHHRLKPTLTIVLDRKTVNTTRELISRLRKELKMELQGNRQEQTCKKQCIFSKMVPVPCGPKILKHIYYQL